ncbi:MAG: DUF1992 domain-containing protein [Acidobacteriota bacterium]
MDWVSRMAEEKIREGMDRGLFDDLSLAGKPLQLRGSSLVPHELRLAYKMLKDAGYLPPEMELRKEVLSLKELLSTVVDGEGKVRLVRAINERVLRLNLMLKRSFPNEDCQVYAGK